MIDTTSEVTSLKGCYFKRIADLALETPAQYLNNQGMPPTFTSYPSDVLATDRARLILPIQEDSDFPLISRVEALWRTLTLDSFEGVCPAPARCGFGFSDWVCLHLERAQRSWELAKIFNETSIQRSKHGRSIHSRISVFAHTLLARILQAVKFPRRSGVEKHKQLRVPSQHMSTQIQKHFLTRMAIKFSLWALLNAEEVGGFYTLEEIHIIKQTSLTKTNPGSWFEEDAGNLTEIEIDGHGLRYLPDPQRMKQVTKRGMEDKGEYQMVHQGNNLTTDEKARLLAFESRMQEVKTGRGRFRTE
jgi:hypothetical protein